MPEPSIKCSRQFAFQPLRPDRLRSLRIAQAVGALSLFVVGGVHLEQYDVAYFSVVPTIGPLFLANFIAASVFGLILLVPIPLGAGRLRLALDSLVALAGVGLSVGGFAGLLVSEHTLLFGFMEHGYRLEIVLALAAEAVATLSLSAFLARVVRRTRGSGGQPAESRPIGPSAARTAGGDSDVSVVRDDRPRARRAVQLASCPRPPARSGRRQPSGSMSSARRRRTHNRQW